MPYICEQRRREILLKVRDAQYAGPGELNYAFTVIALDYIKAKAQDDPERLRYAMLNDVVGALELCKQEFVRRMVTPFEEGKIEANGDIYPA